MDVQLVHIVILLETKLPPTAQIAKKESIAQDQVLNLMAIVLPLITAAEALLSKYHLLLITLLVKKLSSKVDVHQVSIVLKELLHLCLALLVLGTPFIKE